MLQFNLLPDVKKEYIKAKRQKRLIYSISVTAAGASVAVLVILFSFVQFVQKTSINNLTKDIESEISGIESIDGINEILTIQSQLNTLPSLHKEKPETSRIFSYLTQLTPAEVKISDVNLNLEESIITIEGIAPDLASVNRFSDTLKFAKHKAVEKASLDSEEGQLSLDEAEEQVPFTSVTTELSRSEDTASYEIRFAYDPVLFDNTYDVVLIIPQITTTRSTQGKPNLSDQTDNPLFESQPGEEE